MSTIQASRVDAALGIGSALPHLPPDLELDLDDEKTISYFDGVTTGFTAGPRPIAPAEWLPSFCAMAPPAVAASDVSLDLCDAVSYGMAAIAERLASRSRGLKPVFWTASDGREMAGDWADGFMQAVGFQRDEWQPLFDDKKARNLIVALLALSRPEAVLPILEVDPDEEAGALQEIAAEVVPSVQGIHDFWRGRGCPRFPSMTRRATKIGRNDPCPCGSGRKFKRCCGGA